MPPEVASLDAVVRRASISSASPELAMQLAIGGAVLENLRCQEAP